MTAGAAVVTTGAGAGAGACSGTCSCVCVGGGAGANVRAGAVAGVGCWLRRWRRYKSNNQTNIEAFQISFKTVDPPHSKHILEDQCQLPLQFGNPTRALSTREKYSHAI